MNELLRAIYSTGRVEDKDGNAVECFPTSVPFETGALLYDLVRRHNLSRTIEIGMAYGMSALFICQALKDNDTGRHTAIDPAQETSWGSIGRLNIERAGLGDRLRFFPGSSHDVLPRLLMEKESFDFAFVDGMHLFDYTLVEFFYLDKMLEAGGYVAFDDIGLPSVRKAVSFILRNRAYEIERPKRAGRGLVRSAMSTARRVGQEPLGRDWALKLMPGNVCVLRKTADDDRHWKHYNTF
ncbi:MAG TPA: class I SAM-dependent methyltransferase [Blastocatellia bacterium]|jgi:predicted O-methyltransferase YrrM|nr:class I SAM-dependent methyltransferase [Blastocatellia bacterium]